MDNDTAVAGSLGQPTREVFPTSRIILFSLGSMGNVIIATLTGLMTYFYISPETGQADFPQYISLEPIFGLTIFGLINYLGGLLTTFLGPIAASWSDRSKARFGRRKTFIMWTFLPIAILSFMIFTPPVSGISSLNAIYLFVVIILLNIFRTFNNVSGAIAPEFGTTSRTIMQFSTFGSVGWILGYLLGSQVIFVIKDAFASSGMTTLEAFRITVAILTVIGCALSTLQFLVLDEKRFGSGKVSEIKLIDALKKSFKNADYVKFILANQIYMWGDALFNVGLIYFVTVNFGLDESMMLVFGATLIGLSLIQYPFVNILAAKIGKKRVFSIAILIMSFVMVAFAMPEIFPIPKSTLAWIIVCLASVYSSVTGIIPGAIINEIIREDCVRTGVPNEASYNAAGGLLTAIPAGIPSLIIPSLLILGKSPTNNKGVVLVALASMTCLLISLILINLVYNEKKIVNSLKEHGYE